MPKPYSEEGNPTSTWRTLRKQKETWRLQRSWSLKVCCVIRNGPFDFCEGESWTIFVSLNLILHSLLQLTIDFFSLLEILIFPPGVQCAWIIFFNFSCAIIFFLVIAQLLHPYQKENDPSLIIQNNTHVAVRKNKKGPKAGFKAL